MKSFLILILTTGISFAREITFAWDKVPETVTGYTIYIREKDVWVKFADTTALELKGDFPNGKFDAAVSSYIQVGEARLESAKSGLVTISANPSIPKNLRTK